MARSAAALVSGFLRFDPQVRIVGVLFNKIGGKGHFDYLKDAMASVPAIEVFGLPYDESLTIAERHLGLTMAEDAGINAQFISRAGDWVEKHLSIDRLMEQTSVAVPLRARMEKRTNQQQSVVIGIARDQAFCFYYSENLRLLESAGARLVPFSPMRDRALPPNLDGLYLGGGYPELHSRDLGSNREMREAIRNFVESGRLVYAECGGFMYLTEALIDQSGRELPMVGVYPAKVKMLARMKALGYRQVKTRSGSFFPAGMRARGHEFHYSELVGDLKKADKITTVYRVSAGGKYGTEGFVYKNCLASYVHLHFGSNPGIATHIIRASRRIR
jgi:cobyrinic acid a,c-diamide synthase